MVYNDKSPAPDPASAATYDTDAADPNRVNCRTDNELPSVKKSSTEASEPQLDIP